MQEEQRTVTASTNKVQLDLAIDLTALMRQFFGDDTCTALIRLERHGFELRGELKRLSPSLHGTQYPV